MHDAICSVEKMVKKKIPIACEQNCFFFVCVLGEEQGFFINANDVAVFWVVFLRLWSLLTMRFQRSSEPRVGRSGIYRTDAQTTITR